MIRLRIDESSNCQKKFRELFCCRFFFPSIEILFLELHILFLHFAFTLRVSRDILFLNFHSPSGFIEIFCSSICSYLLQILNFIFSNFLLTLNISLAIHIYTHSQVYTQCLWCDYVLFIHVVSCLACVVKHVLPASSYTSLQKGTVISLLNDGL